MKYSYKIIESDHNEKKFNFDVYMYTFITTNCQRKKETSYFQLMKTMKAPSMILIINEIQLFYFFRNILGILVEWDLGVKILVILWRISSTPCPTFVAVNDKDNPEFAEDDLNK